MGLYESLGVKVGINAFGTITAIGGSLVDPEVFRAMEEAGRHFVDMNRYHAAAGRRVAELLGAEACCITCGAAAGVAIAAAACMTGGRRDLCLRLPDTAGMKNEIVMLKSHRIPYDQGLCMTGAKIVEVGRVSYTLPEDLEYALTDRTAMVFYIAESETMRGGLRFEQVAEIAGRHGVPLLVDAAAEIPPVSNIRRFLDGGADMVVFSGGKELRGPQATGLILGKKALIDACDPNCCPNYGVGRAMKIDKENIAGILRAVELFVQKDYDAIQRDWTRMSEAMCEKLRASAAAEVWTGFPEAPDIQPVCVLRVFVRPRTMTAAALHNALFDLDPQIFTQLKGDVIVINPQCLKEEEAAIVAEAILGILQR